MSKSKEELEKEAQEKVKFQGFFGANTVEVVFPDGKKRRVNKFEAAALRNKISKSK